MTSSLAGKALVKLIKRWPSVISKSVITLTNKLQDSNAEEYAVLGSCSVLASQTVLKQLTTKAINELFVKYNIQFSGVSKSFFRISDKDNHTCGLGFSDLVSQVGSMSFDSTGLHWRYNLMANRVLLLLALASRNHPNSSTRLLSETAGHFLKNLKSQLPQTRILAISALNTLLKKSPYKLSPGEKSAVLEDLQGNAKSSLEEALTHTFQEEGFFNETLNSLSHVHIISDSESASGCFSAMKLFTFLKEATLISIHQHHM
ncbi:proteasome activator subunit 4-like [Arachis duranensis]|uniref:Proteasome activator subunit 4-like n=1 Tax=Arachis duranensis TaxID=130453 RepID=A0A6P4BQX8_ARADU|nr:proteasome activator subunit 4-like [Arachis duranensis]